MAATSPNILRVDGSARRIDSVSRSLTNLAVATLQDQYGSINVSHRDICNGIGNVSSAWRNASLTSGESRSPEDRAVLAQSEALINEVTIADLLLISVPIYNFSIPSSLKSWIDLICRDNVDGARASNLTRRFKNKQALIVLTSNFTKQNANDDFATPYLEFMLKFIGIDSVTFIDATGLANNHNEIITRATDAVTSHCIRFTERWDKQTAAAE